MSQYIGYRNGKPYCRRCLPFQGKTADLNYLPKEGIELCLKYPLSEKQDEVSREVLSSLKDGRNVLIHAVTGAGKTELVYRSMEYYLQKRLHVGFATPRKDVVIDLIPRIKEAFKDAKVIGVYGEHSSKLVGDIIVLTTHQLFRYTGYFDLLILDEIDAFPYKGNEVLQEFFYRSIRGNYVLLSATPSKEDVDKIKKENGTVVSLYERYHRNPLPLPKMQLASDLRQKTMILTLMRRFQSEHKPVFIFVPTIEEGKELFFFLHLFVKGGVFVSSKEEERRLNIERFKEGELSYLVTTSILERGVTVKNLQVIVYHSDHMLYTRQALVQIAGRAGRKFDAPKGEVFFFCMEEKEQIKEAIYEIDRYNRKAHLL